ncbi:MULTISPECIES: choline/carnitine O-acyltransferase [Sinomonas]|jgi:hypothetical protein|uniref:choline/carnitine O-acyltransferase n=1 Tax=Sinomonas TaxID=596707 RepID=UPI00110865BE|nr:choline/carnitine O-acyltransferase [Sinomonas gamaensis]
MSELPASYRKYLEGRTRDFIETVRPVLQQSAAEAEHGVRVVLNEPHTLQALIDDSIPFGEVVEDVD